MLADRRYEVRLLASAQDERELGCYRLEIEYKR